MHHGSKSVIIPDVASASLWPRAGTWMISSAALRDSDAERLLLVARNAARSLRSTQVDTAATPRYGREELTVKQMCPKLCKTAFQNVKR